MFNVCETSEFLVKMLYWEQSSESCKLLVFRQGGTKESARAERASRFHLFLSLFQRQQKSKKNEPARTKPKARANMTADKVKSIERKRK